MSDYNYNDMVFNGVANVPNHFKLDGFKFTLMSEYNDSSKIMLFKVKKVAETEKNFTDLLCQKVRMTVEMIYRVYVVSVSHWSTAMFGTNEQSFFISYGILFTEEVLKGPKLSMQYSVGLLSNSNYGLSYQDTKFMTEIHKFENPNLIGFDRVMYTTHIFFIQLDKRFNELDYRMHFIDEILCKFIRDEIGRTVYDNIVGQVIRNINFTHHLIENDHDLIIISELSGYNNITIESMNLNSATFELGDDGKVVPDRFFDFFFTSMTSSRTELNVIYNITDRSTKSLLSTEGNKYLTDLDLEIVRLCLKHPLVKHRDRNDGIRDIFYEPFSIGNSVFGDNPFEFNNPFLKFLLNHETYVIDDDSIIQKTELCVAKKKIPEKNLPVKYIKYQTLGNSLIREIDLENIPYLILIVDKHESEEFLRTMKESNYDINFNIIYEYANQYYICMYVKCGGE